MPKPARSRRATRSQVRARLPTEVSRAKIRALSFNCKSARETKKYAPSVARASGVYKILCKTNGKFYIGSAAHLYQRWSDHLRNLRRGTHHNKHLQAAWFKYRKASFEFKVLQIVKRSLLLAAEQSWLDRTHCAHRTIGFNMASRVRSPGTSRAQTWKGFFDPRGNAVTITNMQEFCRLNALTATAMLQLYRARGKLKSHKGWTHKNSVRQRDYVKTYDGFINTDGKRVGKITNLRKFSRGHGLTASHLIAVAHRRIVSHRGWTHRDGRERLTPKKHTGFIRPDGRRVVIINLSQFCRENGLSVVHMHNLKLGTRNIHKGWTWRPL
jgi:group I intron endonuclease